MLFALTSQKRSYLSSYVKSMLLVSNVVSISTKQTWRKGIPLFSIRSKSPEALDTEALDKVKFIRAWRMLEWVVNDLRVEATILLE